MGLDNGIILVSQVTPVHPSNVDLGLWSECFENEYEICYWRKCWGLRGDIIDAIEMCPDRYENFLKPEDVRNIIDIIKFWANDRERWENHGRSIASYEEILPVLNQDIINLTWLAEYLDNNPEALAYFYDSY